MKETAVSFNSNGDNPLNKLNVVNICGRYEHSCVIKELIFFGDGFPQLSYIIVPPHEKGQLEAFMPVYSAYQAQLINSDGMVLFLQSRIEHLNK